MKFITLLSQLSHNRNYWLSYIFGSLSLQAVALYFQYINEDQPCVICIQVRLLLTLLIVVAIFGLLTRDKGLLNHLSNLSVVLVAGVLLERSYMLLGTERGFIFSDCGFDPGLPAWFQLDVWLPWLYGVETSCGYTPEIIFGITMAESLMVMSVCLIVFSASIFVFGMVKPCADK